MKIVLKDNTEYSVVRVSKNSIADVNNSEYRELASKLGVSCINTTNILLDVSKNTMANLFTIEKDFSENNISEVTFVTQNGEIKETYDTVGRIYQNVSDFVNETIIVLLKFE